MAKKDIDLGNKIGSWAFLIGLLLAVIFGVIGFESGLLGLQGQTIIYILVAIGIIIGFLNVAGKEVQPFMMSGTVLIIASALAGSMLTSIKYIGGIFGALLLIFAPATVIVAIKNVFQLARN